jgi:hypothetical protein
MLASRELEKWAERVQSLVESFFFISLIFFFHCLMLVLDYFSSNFLLSFFPLSCMFLFGCLGGGCDLVYFFFRKVSFLH